MIKTSISQPVKINKALLALGILKGYIKQPLCFLLTTILTLPDFRKQMPEGFPEDFFRTTVLQTWMFIRLKDRIGREKAFEVVRAIVLPTGLAVQQGNFRSVEAPRTFENLIKYQQLTNKEGPTRWNKMEILEQSESKYEFRVYNCMFHDFFTQLGIPELTTLMCEVDNAIFNTYLPEEVTFHRNGIGNRIADGAPACHFVLEYHHKDKESSL